MEKPNKPELTRQDTVYGVEELPVETGGELQSAPDSQMPSTSSGITVAARGLMFSHVQVHVDTDSSDYSAAREARIDENVPVSEKEECFYNPDDNYVRLDIIDKDETENSLDDPDSYAPCTINCFCLAKCKKQKEANSPKQDKKDESK